jgi:hypothetical protein
LNGDFKIQYSRIFHIESKIKNTNVFIFIIQKLILKNILDIKLNYSRADQETIEINGPLKFSIHVMVGSKE